MEFQDLRAQLQSEKPTLRKKGKTALEDEVIRKKIHLSPFETMNIVYAVMSYEKKEIEALKLKGKAVTIDASQFFKQVLKYCVRYGHLLSSKMNEVLQYSLDVLFDQTIPSIVKNVHKSTLCDLLEPKIVYSVPFDPETKKGGWKRLFIYLRQVMVDKRTTADLSNLKLLKGICFNLYNDLDFQSLKSKSTQDERKNRRMDDDNDDADEGNMDVVLNEDELNQQSCKRILRPLLKWFGQLLSFADDNDETSLLIISSIYECLTSLLEYHSLNIMNLLIEELTQTYSTYLLKHIYSVQYLQDKYSEPLLMFLLVFTNKLLELSTDHILFEALLKLPQLYSFISGLNEGLISSEYLIYVLTNCRKKQNRKVSGSSAINASSVGYYQPFVDILDEYSQAKLSYIVINNITRIYVLLWNRFSAKHDFCSFEEVLGEEVTSSSASKAEEDLLPRNKRARKERSSLVGFHLVFERISRMSLNVANTPTIPSQENKVSITNKRFLNNPIQKNADKFLSNDIVLLESLLWTVVTAVNEQLQEFLAVNARQSKFDCMTTLHRWIDIIYQQFIQILQFKDEKQVIGVIIVVLCKLWKLSSYLVGDTSLKEVDEVLATEIRQQYLQLVTTVLDHERSFFKLMNQRVIGLSAFHSELFHLLQVLIEYPVNVVKDSSAQLLRGISKWEVFKIRKCSMSSDQEPNQMEEEEDMSIAKSEDSLQMVTENLFCSYYLSLLRHLSRQVATKSFSGANREEKKSENQELGYLQAWCSSILVNCSCVNYTYQSSFVVAQGSEVFQNLLQFLECVFKLPSSRRKGFLSFLHPQVSLQERKDVFMLYPRQPINDDLTFLSDMCTSDQRKLLRREERKEIRSYLDDSLLFWKSKVADQVKSKEPNGDVVHALLRVGLCIASLYQHYGEFSGIAFKTTVIDIILVCLECIEINFAIIKYIEISHQWNILISEVTGDKIDSVQLSKTNVSVIESLGRILRALQVMSSKSRSLSNSQVSSVDDDFMDDFKDSNGVVRTKSSKSTDDANLNRPSPTSSTQLNIEEVFSFLLSNFQLQFIFTAHEDRDTTTTRILEFFQQYLSGLCEDNQYHSSELILLFAEKISCQRYIADYELLFGILSLFPWSKIHLEWSHLAYLKSFHIFHNLVSAADFWKVRTRQELNVDEDPFLRFILEKVFAEETSVEHRMLNQIWQLRFFQLKVVIEIMKNVKDLSLIKAEITTVFLTAVVDRDIHVRRLAAENAALLFHHFKNPVKVYGSINEKLSEISEMNLNLIDCDPLEVSIIFLFYSTTAKTSLAARHLISKVLSDLFQFIYPILDGWMLEENRSVYRSLLLPTISKISSSQSYSSRWNFVTDYLRYILSLWFKNLRESNLTSADSILKTFPFELVFEEFFYWNWEKREQFYHYFLLDYGRFIIPAIIQIGQPRMRWALLTAFTKGLFGGETDNEIIKSLQSNFIPSKVYQISLSTTCDIIKKMSAKGTSNKNYNDTALVEINSKSKEVSDFMTRVFPSKDLSHQLKKEISGYLNEIILAISTYPDDDRNSFLNHLTVDEVKLADSASANKNPTGNATLQSKNYIIGMLQTIQQLMNLLNLTQLFSYANILELITVLFDRISSTVMIFSRRNCLLFLLVLLENAESIVISRRMVVVELQKIFHYVISIHQREIAHGENAVMLDECFPIIVDSYVVLLRSIAESSSILSTDLKFLLFKDVFCSALIIYLQVSASLPVTDSFNLFSYEVLNGSQSSHIKRLTEALQVHSQKFKDYLQQFIGFIQTETAHSMASHSSRFLSLIPENILSLIIVNDVVPDDGMSSLMTACFECAKVAIEDLLGGMDNWAGLLLFMIRFDELIEEELHYLYQRNYRRMNQISTYQSFISQLLAVCQYIYRLDRKRYFLTFAWPFSKLSLIIMNNINKLKTLISLISRHQFSPDDDVTASDYYYAQPMNAEIKYTKYDPQQLQRQAIVTAYKLMWLDPSLVGKGISTCSMSSLTLTNLAIQSCFAEEVNIHQLTHSGAGSSEFHSTPNQSEGSTSLSFPDQNMSEKPMSPRIGIECVYHSITSHYRLSSSNLSLGSLLCCHYQLNQSLMYQLCDNGNYELFQAMFSNPEECLWSEQLWSCSYLSNANSNAFMPSRRLYCNWIKRLTYCFVQAFLLQAKNLPQVKTKGKGRNSKAPGNLGNNKIVFLLSCCHPLCLISEEMSEILFLLVANESIEIFGVDSSFVVNLFDYLNRFIIKHKLPVTANLGERNFNECYQLVDHLFSLLLQKTISSRPLSINEIGEYQQQPSSSQQTSSQQKASKELLSRKFAQQYHQNVNLLDVIESLYQNHLFPSALLLAELVSESMSISGLRELRDQIHNLNLEIQSSALQSSTVLGFKRETTFRDDSDGEPITKNIEGLREKYYSCLRLQKIFNVLYRRINDVDAIEAIDRSSDLPLQAVCYQRRGQYFEALTTYESVLHTPATTDNFFSQQNFDKLSVYEGIADSLKGLGAVHAFESYSEQIKKETLLLNQNAQNALREWNVSDVEAVDNLSSLAEHHSRYLPENNCLPRLHSLLSSYEHFTISILKSLQLGNNVSIQLQTTKMHDFSIIWSMTNAQVASSSTTNSSTTSSAKDGQKTSRVVSELKHSSILRELLARGSKISDYQKNFDLIHSLLKNRIVSSIDGLLAIDQFDIESLSSNMIHSISPVFYNCWNQIHENLSTMPTATEYSLQRSSAGGWNLTEKDIVRPMMQLQECKLLWRKGLSEAALDRLSSIVLPVLSDIQERTKSLVAKAPSYRQLGNNASNYNNPLIPIAMDSLSEALRLGGLWNSRKGSKASHEIIKQNLQPAIDYAVSIPQKIKSYLALATFTSTLFTNIQNRIQSIEWIQSERVFRDREEELKLCTELQQEQQRQPNATFPNQQPAAAANDKQAMALQVQENRNLLRHIVILKKEIDMDKKERNQLIQSFNQYLLLSIENYLKLLYLSEENDVDVVFQFINLWFKNNFPTATTTVSSSSSVTSSSESSSSMGNITVNVLRLNELILQYLQQQKILSYKFIPLHYQIFSRLGQATTAPSDASGNVVVENAADDSNRFQQLLQQFMILLCSEHPYHVIPQLFALIHEQTVDSVTFKSNNQSSRGELADQILQTLLKTAPSPSFGQYAALIKNMKCLLEGYHELAKASTESMQNAQRTKNIKFKEIQPRGKRFNEITLQFEHSYLATSNHSSNSFNSGGHTQGNGSGNGGGVIPAVITLPISINKWKKYESQYNIIRMKEIMPVFHITENGISRPKIISCLGENGIVYKQLVKGGDDMRQDAVMEQVFENINLTLQRNHETNERQLLIRTYKVIPLTPQTGILQWVENTLPFGAILCDRVNGLHTRYQNSSTDYSHKECRELLQKCVDSQEKEKKFQLILQHFHPMFRYFFIEKFAAHSMDWLQKRSQYIKSVASNSMTGYILGIGDRHAHNILIDQMTGECVHIDFGIVFDQGKGLGTPETVPFRLTRDIVDGMGINGVEGTFRRCCEEVLKVLRENSFNLLTILEVVIYDPLYKWSLSPLKARNKQQFPNVNDGPNQTNQDPINQKQVADLDQLQQVPDFHDHILQRKRNLRGAGNKGNNINNNNNNNIAVVAQQTGAPTGEVTKIPSSNFGKDAAERTLMKIRNKLRGYEDLSYDALTVEGHVDMLIHEAKDPLNLCRIFPGWAPWL